MSETNPFTLIAEYFPFKHSLNLCETDRAKLVHALLEKVNDLVERKQPKSQINTVAARHLTFIYKDYGVGYAAAYFTNLHKISNIDLDVGFHKYPEVPSIIKDIYANDKNNTLTDSDVASIAETGEIIQ